MSAALPIPSNYTEEEFLELEAASPVRHEFLNGVVYAMAGGTDGHTVIAVNIVAELRVQLRGKSCRPYSSDILLRIQQGDDVRMYYPDVAVYCQPIDSHARTKENPTVVVEVLSPTTEAYDRDEKRKAYLEIPALQTLLLVSSKPYLVTVWTRGEHGWESEDISDPSAVIFLPAIGAELPMGEIYDGLAPL